MFYFVVLIDHVYWFVLLLILIIYKLQVYVLRAEGVTSVHSPCWRGYKCTLSALKGLHVYVLHAEEDTK